MATSWRRSTSTRGRARPSAGLALLVLAVALVPVLQPLISTQLTCGYDNAFHLWRAVQIERLWDDGILYSRWAPDMAHGFGFPLYLFASPFPPALVALLHRLGAAWPVALNSIFALGVVLGSLGMFWAAADIFGREGEGIRPRRRAWMAGLVAGIAYAYAPFQAYDVFSRGSLWESFAWAFPPLVLLGLHRWSLTRERRYLVLGSLAFAALILSHHLFAFLFAPLFALWALVPGGVARRWDVVGRGALGGVLGLGITAFFWLPALLERPFIQTGRLLGTWVFDYHYNFLSLHHLLALPRRADPRLLNDWPEKALGLVPVLVALASLVGWRRTPARRRWQVATLWAVAIGAGLLTLPVTRPIWDAVPLLEYVQFPWRALGPAAFCLALLAGAGWQGLSEALPVAVGRPAVRGGLVAAGLSAVLMLGSLGWLYPAHCGAPSEPSVATMIRWERLTDTLGTTAKGEYLPMWVVEFPEVELDAFYQAGVPVERLDLTSLPAGAQVLEATYGAQHAELRLRAPEAFRARYLAFYYPGWRVTIDGEAVPVTPEAPSGLLTFDVPAGEHLIEVAFGETPVRWVGNAAALLSGAVLVACSVVSRPRVDGAADEGAAAPGETRGGAVAPAVVMLIVAAKLVVIDGGEVLWRATRLADDGTLRGAGEAVNFGHRALLLGWEGLPAAVRGDGVPEMTLYWRALDPGPAAWHVGLTLIAADGSRWPVGLRPARWARTPPPLHAWPADAYARMDFDLELPVGLAPGRFEVVLSLFDRATAIPASVLGAGGNPVAPALALGEIEIRAPAQPAEPVALGVRGEAAPELCGDVGLWQATPSRRAAAPGDLVEVTTVWEAVRRPEADAALTFALEDADGTVVRTWEGLAPVPWWPTSRWTAGDRWTGRHSLRLPGSLTSGEVTLSVRLDGCILDRQALDVTAPERRWAVPAGFTPVDVQLGGVARLAGVLDLPEMVAPGDAVRFELAWEALREMETSYRVFVHLVDREGTVVAQDDGEPAGWTRPTTGWAVGEVVIDPRSLVVPAAGAYEIRVGLYDAEGVRLTTADGGDAMVLGEVRAAGEP